MPVPGWNDTLWFNDRPLRECSITLLHIGIHQRFIFRGRDHGEHRLRSRLLHQAGREGEVGAIKHQGRKLEKPAGFRAGTLSTVRCELRDATGECSERQEREKP